MSKDDSILMPVRITIKMYKDLCELQDKLYQNLEWNEFINQIFDDAIEDNKYCYDCKYDECRGGYHHYCKLTNKIEYRTCDKYEYKGNKDE